MRGKTNSFDRSSVVSLGSKAAGNILIIGEKLRHTFTKATPPLIKDRRYRLRVYQRCFVGTEAVDWLVKHEEVKDRATATNLMSILQKYNVIHHVCDDHGFKDEMLFFRFRVDDSTSRTMQESNTYVQGTNIFQRLMSDTSLNPLLKLHTEVGQKYPNSFYGAELVSWLLRTGFCVSREKALWLGKDLLEADIIRHVKLDHHFKDERILYHFHPIMMDLTVTKLSTLDREAGRSASGEGSSLSLVPPPGMPRSHSNSSSSDSSMDRNSTTGSKSDVSFSDHNHNGLLLEDRVQGLSSDQESQGLPMKTSQTPPHPKRLYSAEELRRPDSPFVQQHIKITGDSVGFGLVIRGNGPTYVQTVDPKGPAAAAGLKVKQYLASVNGVDVLDRNHTDVAKLILTKPYELSLVVLQFKDLALLVT